MTIGKTFTARSRGKAHVSGHSFVQFLAVAVRRQNPEFRSRLNAGDQSYDCRTRRFTRQPQRRGRSQARERTSQELDGWISDKSNTGIRLSPFSERKDVLILMYVKPFAERKATMAHRFGRDRQKSQVTNEAKAAAQRCGAQQNNRCIERGLSRSIPSLHHSSSSLARPVGSL